MTMSLEDMLRASQLRRGAIQMACVDGSWGVTISHQHAHQVHPNGKWHDDPVEALRVALIEDDRICRDTARRYEAAEKLGDQIDLEDYLDEDGFCAVCEGGGCDACRDTEKKKFPTPGESCQMRTNQEHESSDEDDFGDLL